MQSKYLVFLEVVALVGCVAFFSGRHQAHLNEVQKSLDTIQKSVEASEKALKDLRVREEAIACARIETDKKLLEAPDGAMCYEYYGRLLREDAERRRACDKAAGGADVPVR